MKLKIGPFAVSLMAATAPWATYATIMGSTVPVYLTLLVFVAVAERTVAGRTIYFGRPVLALVSYCGLIGASAMWSMMPSLLTMYYNLTNWVMYLVAFFAVLSFMKNIKLLRWFANASALGALITLPLLAPYEGGLLETSRYAVPGHNANFTAYVLAGSFFVIALAIRYLGYSFYAKLALFGVLAVIFFSLTLMGTRGAQLSVCLAGLTIVWGKWVTKSMASLASFSAILLSGTLSLGLLTPLLVAVDSFSSRSTGDLSGRLVIWSDAISFIREYPIFGIGPGSFLEVGALEIGAHNIFLVIMLDTGLVGMMIFLWFLFEVWRSFRGLGKEGQRIFFAFLMYWLPISISGHWETAPYSWGVVAFAMNVARVLAKEKSGSRAAVPEAPALPGNQVRV